MTAVSLTGNAQVLRAMRKSMLENMAREDYTYAVMAISRNI